MACRGSIFVQCILLIFLWLWVDGAKGHFEPPTGTQVGIYPFQNTSLPWDQRVDDLVARLTLEEIQLQMARGGAGTSGGPAPAIPRLGIGPYQWDTECLRGDAYAPGNGNSTAFPQAIGLAAAFSPDLHYKIAAAVGIEVRGKHNDYVKQGVFLTHTGASCFSPVINIARDPRWGRLQETYGEDPFLSGVLAKHFVRGLQGNDSRYVQVTGTCKHFDAHTGPENIPVSRFSFNAEVSEVDWRTTFLAAFKICLEAGPFSLMCSYNRINGIPSCAHKTLLTDILRNEWGFTGYVVSDEGAIENIITKHHYLNNSVDTVATCVNAGTNLEVSEGLANSVFMSIVDAVNQGKLSESLVRERVKPLFYTRMRLGEFDPPDNNPYSKLDGTVVESPEHQELAVEAAVKTFVLLKNLNNILPLKPLNFKNVALIGPMADNYEQLFGDYAPTQSRIFTKTPLQGLQELFPNIKTGTACKDGTPCQTYDSNVVKSVVSGADLVFVALGTGQAIEMEGHDRVNLSLPGSQLQLGMDVLNYNKNSTVILLLFNGGPLNVSFFDFDNHIQAILECFLPAQATGDALVRVLTNKDGKSSPAGRLPVTWPLYDWQIPPMINYSMHGRTYRYSDDTPLYNFGYGLSYSTFSYPELVVDSFSKNPELGLNVTALIINTGLVSSDEVIQCYVEWQNKSLPVPLAQLVYFNRISMAPSEEVYHSFSVSGQSLAYWDNGTWSTKISGITFSCGGSPPFQKRPSTSDFISAYINFNPTQSGEDSFVKVSRQRATLNK